VPCSDNKLNSVHEINACGHDDNHSSPDHEDHCSPFCVCDCCSTNVMVQLDFDCFRNQNTEVFSAFQKPYSDLYSAIFQNKILQPPREV
tara:strand:- start:145 stop:411 length:267 start_codon:yes stop_codon:yes gene_type:complete